MPVSASAVLDAGSGLCLAKSHLLVALWRACGLPAGFCYQRLLFDTDGGLYVTHGLAAVWLPAFGWYRCDARGNTKEGIDCAFTPGTESLAYTPTHDGEYDPLIFGHLVQALAGGCGGSQRSCEPVRLSRSADRRRPARGSGHARVGKRVAWRRGPLQVLFCRRGRPRQGASSRARHVLQDRTIDRMAYGPFRAGSSHEVSVTGR